MNFLSRLSQYVRLVTEFIRDAVNHLYCADNGHPAIAPVRLIKMMMPGYLFGIPSERRLVKEIRVNVIYRGFLRMGLTEKVPDASTLSPNRIRLLKRQTEWFGLDAVPAGSHRAEHQNDGAAGASLSLFYGDIRRNNGPGCP